MAQLGSLIQAELDELTALRARVQAERQAEVARINARIAELTAAADLVKRDLAVEPIVQSLLELRAKRG